MVIFTEALNAGIRASVAKIRSRLPHSTPPTFGYSPASSMTAVARAPSSTRSSIVASCFGRGPELLEFIWTDIIRPYEDKRNAEEVLVSVRIVDSDGLVSTLRH